MSPKLQKHGLRRCMYVCMHVFILQQDNTQNIMPEGQQGPEALTAARNKNVSNKATTYNMTETKHNKNPSLISSGCYLIKQPLLGHSLTHQVTRESNPVITNHLKISDLNPINRFVFFKQLSSITFH